MLRKLTFAALFGGLMFALSAPLSAQEELAIGDKAPLTEFKMTNIDGQDWSLVSDGQLLLGGERSGQGEHQAAEEGGEGELAKHGVVSVSYTHLRAHET